MSSSRLIKTAAVLLSAAAFAFLVRTVADQIAGLLLPFLAAWIASAVTRPLAEWLSRRTKLNRRICGAAVCGILFFFAGYAAVRLSARLAEEVSDFAAGFGDHGEAAVRFFDELKEKLPLPKGFYDSPVYETILSALREAAASFGGKLTAFVSSLLSAIPGSVLGVVVFVASLYYLTADREGVAESIRSLLPVKTAETARNAFLRISGALFGYLRAYALLLAATFFELALGLTVLGAPYVLVLSLVIAVVDALPILGAGAILGPWAAVSFLRGETAFGTGLVILLGVMYLVRQFLEPRLIGRFIGVHPLVALGAVFVGYRVGDVFGMIAAPVILYTIKAASAAKKTE